MLRLLSNSGSCFDPYAGYLMEEARKKAKAFLEKLAGLRERFLKAAGVQSS